MTVKVVDASALAALLFKEPTSGAVLERLSGVSLAAPPLLSFEVTNTCLKKCRREPEHRSDLIESLGLFRNLKIEEMPVDHEAVFALALETKLSAYDASYLWLALELDAELVTLDVALARVWIAHAKR